MGREGEVEEEGIKGTRREVAEEVEGEGEGEEEGGVEREEIVKALVGVGVGVMGLCCWCCWYCLVSLTSKMSRCRSQKNVRT